MTVKLFFMILPFLTVFLYLCFMTVYFAIFEISFFKYFLKTMYLSKVNLLYNFYSFFKKTNFFKYKIPAFCKIIFNYLNFFVQVVTTKINTSFR